MRASGPGRTLRQGGCDDRDRPDAHDHPRRHCRRQRNLRCNGANNRGRSAPLECDARTGDAGASPKHSAHSAACDPGPTECGPDSAEYDTCSAGDDAARSARYAACRGAGMMRPGMMGHSMMGGMPMMGPRGHMMKVMFAIVDTNGDGALSFEEVMAVHKRIFDRIDANKDGKVTLEELQTFMRE